MPFDLKTLLVQTLLTLRSPREGAAWAIGLNIPRRQAWEILIVVILVSVVLAGLISITFGGSVEGSGLLGPVALTVVQAGFLWMLVQLVYHGGKLLGGTGTLADSIIAVAWMQIVLLFLQIAVLLLVQIVPLGLLFVNIVGLAFFFWLLTNFVAEVHGFDSLVLVFLGILGGFFVFAILASVVLSALGLEISGSV